MQLMLHIGEWGFRPLDGKKILFDTGSSRCGIENVYLSHNHKDHTGGLSKQILFQQQERIGILDLLTKH